MLKHLPIISLIVIASLVLVACTPSQAISKVQSVVTAVEIALPVILVAGSAAGAPITPDLQQRIVGYVRAVDVALDQTATEMQSGDPAALQAAKITGFFSAAAAPNLQGAPANVVAAVQSISAAVQAFLEAYGKPSFAIAAAAAPAPSKPVKLSGADKKALRDIQAKVRAQAAQLVR